MPDPTPLHLPTHQGYDLWAPLYDSDGNPLIALEERILLPLLGDVRGLHILDAGCGTGRHAIPLAQRGAHVTAIDFSIGMLAAAQAKHGAGSVKWLPHDLSITPWPITPNTFDLVLSALVLDHVRDVPAYFAQLARAARPGARILISVMHPAMMLRGVQARFTDPSTGQRVMPASAPNQISDYINAAVKSRLTIEHVSEHAVDEALVAASPRAEKHAGWPLLLLMVLQAPK